MSELSSELNERRDPGELEASAAELSDGLLLFAARLQWELLAQVGGEGSAIGRDLAAGHAVSLLRRSRFARRDPGAAAVLDMWEVTLAELRRRGVAEELVPSGVRP